MPNHIDLNITGNDGVHEDLQGIVERGSSLARPMRVISNKLVTSIRLNFDKGGRYSSEGSLLGGSKTWEAVKSAPTYKGGKKKGTERGSILRRSSHLMRSIQPDSTENSASASTNVEYAAIHNFGGTTKHYARSEIFTRNRSSSGSFTAGTARGKGHTIGEHTKTTPARPYMVVQQQDLDDYEEILVNHILTRSGQ